MNILNPHPRLKPFNFTSWIDENQHLLKPPVANKQLFDEKTGMVIMIVGGPNQRVDFHDDPVEEFFYQLRGDMLLKVAEGGKIYDIPIREGEVFLLPPHVRHSPQRPQTDSVGLVVEGNRHADDFDAFEWFCFECGDLVYRASLKLADIEADLPPIFSSFYKDKTQRK
ncbi:MAG: 3-hydroxyanthranilate 3,4-dioxygenase, partial [Burkholderiaceae bacterium]